MSFPTIVVLVGVSVRMLAESARRGGIRAVSLDWFADTDTAASSVRCHRVADDKGFDVDQLLWAAERCVPAKAQAALIYGGGFDGTPDVLARLANGRILWGNTPDTVRQVKSPDQFFRALQRLGIPHPEIRWTFPDGTWEPGAWLMKKGSSEGGSGVEWASAAPNSSDPTQAAAYFQRKSPGLPCSALFLAHGSGAAIIGFNALFTSDHRPGHPFLFAGARTLRHLDRRLCTAIRDYANELTRVFSLRGLNSLDFVLDEDEVRVLEINPRPSATLGLHDADYAHGLLLHHIDACRGMSVEPRRRRHTWRAFKILYAQRSTVIPPKIRWPVWCSDRPRAGTPIAIGQPVCSIRAESCNPATLEPELLTRERAVRASLVF